MKNAPAKFPTRLLPLGTSSSPRDGSEMLDIENDNADNERHCLGIGPDQGDQGIVSHSFTQGVVTKGTAMVHHYDLRALPCLPCAEVGKA